MLVEIKRFNRANFFMRALGVHLVRTHNKLTGRNQNHFFLVPLGNLYSRQKIFFLFTITISTSEKKKQRQYENNCAIVSRIDK